MSVLKNIVSWFQTKESEMVSDIMSDFSSVFNNVVTKLENAGESMTKRAEVYALEVTHFEQLKTLAEAEAQKAKDFAAKIKAWLP